MRYAEALAAIRKGDLKQVYLLAGDEPYLAERLEKALLAKLLPDGVGDALQVISGGANLVDWIARIETAPFFAEKNVILVRNAALFKEKKAVETAKKNAAEDRFVAVLEDMPPYSVLILQCAGGVDKRRKLYKAIERAGCVAELSQLRAWEIGDWLQAKLEEIGCRFDREAQQYFVEAASVMQQISLSFLDQEVEKIVLYADKTVIGKAEVAEVLAGIPEISVFAFLEAVGDKNAPKALRLLGEELRSGGQPLRLLPLLARYVRQLLTAKRLAARRLPSRQMASALGVAPFIAEKIAAKSRRFEETQLLKTLAAFAGMDYAFKSGQADCAALERLVIGLCA